MCSDDREKIICDLIVFLGFERKILNEKKKLRKASGKKLSESDEVYSVHVLVKTVFISQSLSLYIFARFCRCRFELPYNTRDVCLKDYMSAMKNQY